MSPSYPLRVANRDASSGLQNMCRCFSRDINFYPSQRRREVFSPPSLLPSFRPSQLSPVNRRLVTNYITFRAPSPPSPRAKPSVRPFVSGGVWRMMFLVPALAAHAPALIPARLPFPLPRIYRGHLEPANFQLSPVFVRDSELWASKIFHIFLEGLRTQASLFQKRYFPRDRSRPGFAMPFISIQLPSIHPRARQQPCC